MTESVQNTLLREALERWKKAQADRTRLAQEIMSGKRDYDPAWPRWLVFDIKAEITRLEEERTKSAAKYEQAKRAHDAKEAAKAKIF